MAHSKDYRLPYGERQGESDNVFQQLGPNRVGKVLNQVEDEANSYPNPMGENLDRGLVLALHREKGPKASSTGHLGGQGTSPTGPRDT